MHRPILFLLLIISSTTHAQQSLDLPLQNRCIFSTTEWDEELYRYPADPRVQRWVSEICLVGGVTQNFELVQASVEAPVALYDPATGKRYILFSQTFIGGGNKLEVYGALAHEIAHHACGHRLDGRQRAMEEAEADEFMGFILGHLKGIGALEGAQKILQMLPGQYSDAIDDEARRMAMTIGWRRAVSSLSISSAAFDSDPNKEYFLQQQFPFPPPPCCSPVELRCSAINSATKLGDLANILTNALDRQGYYYRKFMSVPGGFAIVTQMEQFTGNFASRSGTARWADKPVAETFKGYLDYFYRLFLPEKAHFRTFVFLVTDRDFNTQGTNVSKSQAAEWYAKGVNRLPESIGKMPKTASIAVTSLVYEFEVPEGDRHPRQKCPGVETRSHLEGAGLWRTLGCW